MLEAVKQGNQDEDSEAIRQQQLAERLSGIGIRLQGEIDTLVAEKKPIEDRMISALRQYSGQYEPDLLSSIRSNAGSEAFINLTRAKTNTLVARLCDTVLPSDDSNFGIEPTPIAELSGHTKSTKPIGVTPEGAEIQMRDMVKGVQDAATECAVKMQLLMEDQLAEANYNAVLRDVIQDAGVFGTGILKGPQPVGRTRTSWKPISDGETTVRVMEQVTDMRPAPLRVDPFDFFPDMSALSIDDAEFVYERHYISRRGLRELRRDPSFLTAQIKLILDGNSPDSEPTHLQARRSLSETSGSTQGKRFELWEYHGPVSREDLEACGMEMPDDSIDEMQACIWFTAGKVIKAALQPLDTGQLPYSVFTLETDGTSLFGYGIPDVMKDSQRVANSVYRAILDNSAWAVLGAWLIDDAVAQVTSVDGKIRPGCQFHFDSQYSGGQTPVQHITMDVHIDQLMALFKMSNELIDQETQMPLIAQGEGHNAVNQTAQGTAMMLNAANTALRRHVKRFDDQITKPFIRMLYDYNMQYHNDDSVKGDYEVVARGTSALLEKEQQTQGMLQLWQMAENPLMKPWIDPEGLVKEMAKLMRLPKSVLKNKDQVEADAQNNPPQQDPRVAIENGKLELAKAELEMKQGDQQQNMALAKLDRELEKAKLQVSARDSENDLHRTEIQAQRESERIMSHHELTLAKMAEDRNITIEQMRQTLGMQRMKLDNENKLFNAEAAIKMQTGQGI